MRLSNILLKIRAFFMRKMAPVSLFIGKIGIPTKNKLSLKTSRILEHVQDGDILIFGKRWEMSNLFIPGRYTHCTIFNGRWADGSTVIEAVHPCVRKASLEEVMSHYTRVAVLRAMFLSSGKKSMIPVYAATKVGVPYDLFFEKTEARFYCSELVTWAIEKAWGKAGCPWQHKDVFGMLTTVPMDFYNSSKFAKVYEETV